MMTRATSVLFNILTVANINLPDISKHRYLADTSFLKSPKGGLTHHRQVVDLVAKLIDFTYVIRRP